MATSIELIRSVVATTKKLTLDNAVLGAEQWQRLAQVFPLPEPQVFTLDPCVIVASTTHSLTFHGTFAHLFPRKNVVADVVIFDSGGARHAVVKIPVPQDADTAYAYLSQYSVDRYDRVDPEKEAPTSGLWEYFDTVRFSSTKSMIFSTLDFTVDESARGDYPFVGAEEFPVARIKQGLNLAADISLDEEDGNVGAFLGQRLSLPGLSFEDSPYWCLIEPDEEGTAERRPRFRFARRPTNATLTIVAQQLVLSLDAMSVVLDLGGPLEETTRGPRVVLDGTVKVSSHPLSVIGTFDANFSYLSLSFRRFPSLKDLSTQFKLGLESWPAPLSNILNIQLSDLTIGCDLVYRTVPEIRFVLTTQQPIWFIDKVLSLTPTFSMQIADPFDSKRRGFEGSLRGDWDFKGVAFETEVGYPGWWFYAGMKKGQEASTKELAATLFPDVNLPELTFKTMWIEGSIQDKSFSAAIETKVSDGKGTDTAWGFDAPPEIALSCAVECQPQKGIVLEACSVRFNLPLAGVNIFLSGEYAHGQGLQFEGSTGPGQTIKIGKLINDLINRFNADDAALPDAIKTLEFVNLAVSFNTGPQKRFRFTGEARLEIEGTPCEMSLTVELEDADKVPNGKYRKGFLGTLKAGGAQFALKVESGPHGSELVATWEKEPGSLQLDLGSLGGSPEVRASLKTLLTPPKKASVKLELDDGSKVKRLTAACLLDNDMALAFLLARNPSAQEPAWITAFGVVPPKVSASDLGALGKVMSPYDITLNKLRVIAASADAPQGEQLALAGKSDTFTRGLLLQGALEFGGTSFTYPFECRLGGDKKPPELTGTSTGTGASTGTGSTGAVTTEAARSADKTADATAPEANNNVAVGRTIGPVTFRKARLAYRDERVYVLLDAALGTGGIALELTGLNLSLPLTSLLKPPTAQTFSGEIQVGLDGLSISYSNPPLTISGGLVRTTAVKPYTGAVYRGHLLIKAEAFQITVLGCYGKIEVQGQTETKPALFLYGAFVGALGGPPAFFVTGLALGGGYNMRLVLPKVEDVADFPLVLAVTNPDKFAKNPNEGFERLTKVIEPSAGDYWLAVGVKFDSFKMADSFALFCVSFGTRLQFALLGLTRLTLPRGAARDKAAFYAELAIRAVLDPEAGVFSIEGRLTQSSYVLAKELQLTGGFAFFVWFGKAPEAGDFVISLGGYHPEFVPPAHYPVVPRVGIRGKIGQRNALTVAGEAYLAITPSCVMAGLKFEAAFETDVILVAFVAYADFIIAWAPFHYDISIGVSISLMLQELRSFRLEISASLHLWGPPFAGTAEISLGTLAVTVEFGDRSGEKTPALTRDEFQKAFLPPPDAKGKAAGLSAIRIADGLVREVKDAAGKATHRIVNPYELMIETESVVPCTEVRVGAAEPGDGAARRAATRDTAAAGLGIRPMAATELQSSHVVTIKRIGVPEAQSAVEKEFRPVEWPRKNFPEALWSNEAGKNTPDAAMIRNVPSGVVLRVQPTAPKRRLGPFRIAKFMHEDIPKYIRWPKPAALPQLAGPPPFPGVSPENERRDQIRQCLVNHLRGPGTPEWNEITFKDMTSAPERASEYFQAPPTCAALGQKL